MIVALASLAGVALFLWPYLGLGPFPAAPALAVAGGAVVLLAAIEAAARRLDTRLLALLAALAAVDAALRLVLVTGIGGFSPIFFLILCAGFVFGPTFGFLTGATALLVSALATGGVGPWLPYQMFGAGWVGMFAGLVGLRWHSLPALAVAGLLSGFAFGLVLDLWDWSYLRGAPGAGFAPGLPPAAVIAAFGRFYLVTSALYDAFRAFGNVLMVLLLGPPVLAAMQRLKARFTLVVE